MEDCPKITRNSCLKAFPSLSGNCWSHLLLSLYNSFERDLNRIENKCFRYRGRLRQNAHPSFRFDDEIIGFEKESDALRIIIYF
jgi:hypothetical protein